MIQPQRAAWPSAAETTAGAVFWAGCSVRGGAKEPVEKGRLGSKESAWISGAEVAQKGLFEPIGRVFGVVSARQGHLRVDPRLKRGGYTAESTGAEGSATEAGRIFARQSQRFYNAFGGGRSPLPCPPSVHVRFLAVWLGLVPGATLLNRSVVLALAVWSVLLGFISGDELWKTRRMPVGRLVRDQVSDFLFRKPL